MIINTMLVGHVVTASVTRIDKDESGNTVFTCRFMYHTQSGSKRLCLDFGQKWNASEGYEFTCQQVQIDRATEYMKDMTDGDGLNWSAALRLKKALAS